MIKSVLQNRERLIKLLHMQHTTNKLSDYITYNTVCE